MALYKLDEWEHSEPSDSDWYAIVFDSEKDELRRIEIGTTRFANSLPLNNQLHDGTPLLKPTDDILVRAKAKLADIIFHTIRMIEHAGVLEPDKLIDGTRVRFLSAHKSALKTCDELMCGKCNGTGKWANPRNNSDQRPCFACKGSGLIKKNFKKVTGEGGKLVWQKIDQNSTGLVISSRAYGQFYGNGYNKPGRSNTTVIIKLDDGREVQGPLEKLRLDKDPLSDDELRQKAAGLSQHGNFYAAFRTANMRL